MKGSKSPTVIAIERMRLLFPVPDEERIAVALTEFWAAHAGERIVDLRPTMTMGEVLDLAQDHLWTSAEFSHMLELAEIGSFDDQFECMTLRDFVRYVAGRSSHPAQQGRRTE